MGAGRLTFSALPWAFLGRKKHGRGSLFSIPSFFVVENEAHRALRRKATEPSHAWRGMRRQYRYERGADHQTNHAWSRSEMGRRSRNGVFCSTGR